MGLGPVKGVTLSQAGLHAQSEAKIARLDYAASDVYLHTAPMFHVGGLSSALAMLHVGACQILTPKFSPTQASTAPAISWDLTNSNSRIGHADSPESSSESSSTGFSSAAFSAHHLPAVQVGQARVVTASPFAQQHQGSLQNARGPSSLPSPFAPQEDSSPPSEQDTRYDSSRPNAQPQPQHQAGSLQAPRIHHQLAVFRAVYHPELLCCTKSGSLGGNRNVRCFTGAIHDRLTSC